MNEEIDEARKKALTNKIEKSQAGLDSVMPTFVELYNAYKAFLSKDVTDYLDSVGKNRTAIYYIMNKLQKVNSKFVEAYFTNKQFAKINEKPSLNRSISIPLAGELYKVNNASVQQTKEALNALQNAVDHYTIEDDESILYHALTTAFEDLQIFGTCVLKCDWSNKLIVERIHLKNIKFDVEAENANQLKYVVHDIYLTKDEILELRDSGVFENDIDYSKVKTESTNANQVDEAKRIKLQEVYEFEGGKWFVSTLFNKEIVLRNKIELPMGLPFIIGKIKNQKTNPDGSENDTTVLIYGDSIAAPLIPIQREITILRNQMLDDATEKSRWIIKDNTVNPFDFMNRKIPAIKTNGNPQTDFKEIPTGNNRDKQYNTDKLEMEGQEAIGVVDYSSNSGKQMNDTATGISILTSESNTVLQHLLRGCNETVIKLAFRKITNLVWAYGDAKLFYGIDRNQDLEFNVGVDVGLGATNPQQQLQSKTLAHSKMIETAQLYAGINPLKMVEKLENAEKFYYREILPLMGIENYEEYYNDEQARENENINGITNMGGNSPGVGIPTEGFNQI